MKKSPITVQASIAAPLQKVWDYWTGPEHITQWNQASEDWHCPKASNDLRTGGKFSSTMAAKDGSMSFDFEGVYDEVIPGELIRYTMADGREVSISFEVKDGMTLVIETFDPESMHSEELQRAGWQAIMDNFKRYVETMSRD
ncbi:Putative polyketide cyclase (CypC) [Mariniradius saccharolyticus AK6]|uniref:Polyketide cyclase (CypC) n=1 Tax=Mariniradius saccharolyticus AK6 TaxID=1239962 RepID=M7X9Y0_9BACT|nr:SRPBCC family protein [Mariniradius saccharolyticus]EMS31433.1 Putative polyketide cyclase (CypC) [Mariniradius saccharolyticus AK6]